MQEIIRIQQIEIGSEKEPGCDARELHGKLQVETRFNDWIQRRIEEVELTRNLDYTEFYSNLSKTPDGGRPSAEYLLTLDSAKHIAMLEKSKIGKEIRQYFIDFEKRTRKALEEMAASKAQVAIDMDLFTIERIFTAAKRIALGNGASEIDARDWARKYVEAKTGVNINAQFDLPKIEAPKEIDIEKILLDIYKQNHLAFLIRRKGKTYLLENRVMGVYDAQKEVIFFYTKKLYEELKRKGIKPRKLEELRRRGKLWKYPSQKKGFACKIDVGGMKISCVGLKYSIPFKNKIAERYR